ncbi:hypothetical protein [uncultured Dialister sp.]|nr:hypothetical protein [uncultured Dialister sp.]
MHLKLPALSRIFTGSRLRTGMALTSVLYGSETADIYCPLFLPV